MEKITYLVTNYNNGKYLSECLDSVLAQSNTHWECLVIDDGSTDNSIEVLKRYSNDKINVIYSEENLGQIKATIRLMSAANTDIVGLLDSDDSLHPDATSEVLRAYATSSHIGLVTSNSIQYDEDMNEIILLWSGRGIPVGCLSSIVFGYVSALKTFRISSYQKTQGYDLNMLCGEDLDLVYKLEESCKHYYINKFLYNRRNVPTSKSKNIQNWLIGIENHKLARLRALKRRDVKGIKLILCKLYVLSEHQRLLNKHYKRKYRKKIFHTVTIFSKYILSELYFRSVVFRIK